MEKALISLSWGHQYPDPGLSNKAMAKEIAKVKEQFRWILTQIEVAEALKQTKTIPDFIVGEPGVYINTYQVMEQMAEWFSNHSIDYKNIELWVLCHQAHWPGCQRVLKRLGLEANRIPVFIPYDPDSYQWYTRGPIRAFLGYLFRGLRYLFKKEIKFWAFL